MAESRPTLPQQPVPQRINPPQATFAPRAMSGAPVAPQQPAAPRPPAPPKEDNEPISLVDEPAGGAPAVSKIKAFGSAATAKASDYHRKPNANGTGACRMRSFHGRMSAEGLAFLDEKINEWLEQHPEIEVKFVSSTIGLFEGKVREQAMVLNVWY